MTIGGTTSSTNARTYTATFSLLASYVWEDGSTDSKSVTWTIGRAAVAVPAQSGVLTYTGSIQSPVWTGYDSEKMTIGGTTTSSDTSVATVSMSGTTVTVKSVASGSATITVSVSEGTNYTAPVNVTCSVTASEIPSFANATWEEISYASQNNLIPDTWLVGDEKDITLTTGETLTFQIYDFGHDLLADDSGYAGITLGMKNLMADTKAMDSSGSNAGSFSGSELYAWLTGDLWDSLPSDLKAVIQPVTKYASEGDQSKTILTEIMSIFLLSEVEAIGTISYWAAGEGSQYPIFTDNNSRIKYLSNGTGDAAIWWQRSPYATGSTRYCTTLVTGGCRTGK